MKIKIIHQQTQSGGGAGSRVESEQAAAASLSAQLRLLMKKSESASSGKVFFKDREFHWTTLGDGFHKTLPREYLIFFVNKEKELKKLMKKILAHHLYFIFESN